MCVLCWCKVQGANKSPPGLPGSIPYPPVPLNFLRPVCSRECEQNYTYIQPAIVAFHLRPVTFRSIASIARLEFLSGLFDYRSWRMTLRAKSTSISRANRLSLLASLRFTCANARVATKRWTVVTVNAILLLAILSICARVQSRQVGDGF